MRIISSVFAALAIVILSTGCSQKTDTDASAGNAPASDTSSSPVNQQLQNVEQAATNAWQKTKEATTDAWMDAKDSLNSAMDYSYEKKDDFVTTAQGDLDRLDQKIQTMSDKTDASLHEKRAALDQKLTDVKNATQDNWNDTKAAFKNAYTDVKNSIRQDWSGSTTNNSSTATNGSN